LGDAKLDRAAWGSITASTPFPPLPKAFSGEELRLAFYFYYNSPPEMSQFSISPCSDVQATNGSTLQFAASGNGITASSVSWGISGTGCTKSACGTISNSGLYTAPANVPSPPTVIVEATSRTDTNITAKSKITIVSANSPH
jgi:hypothetical protein